MLENSLLRVPQKKIAVLLYKETHTKTLADSLLLHQRDRILLEVEPETKLTK